MAIGTVCVHAHGGPDFAFAALALHKCCYWAVCGENRFGVAARVSVCVVLAHGCSTDGSFGLDWVAPETGLGVSPVIC